MFILFFLWVSSSVFVPNGEESLGFTNQAGAGEGAAVAAAGAAVAAACHVP